MFTWYVYVNFIVFIYWKYKGNKTPSREPVSQSYLCLNNLLVKIAPKSSEQECIDKEYPVTRWYWGMRDNMSWPCLIIMQVHTESQTHGWNSITELYFLSFPTEPCKPFTCYQVCLLCLLEHHSHVVYTFQSSSYEVNLSNSNHSVYFKNVMLVCSSLYSLNHFRAFHVITIQPLWITFCDRLFHVMKCYDQVCRQMGV